MDRDDFLEHFGIKGMKWGQRKAEREANASSDHKEASAVVSKAKTGGLGALSNKDMQTAIQRMDLENRYKDLRYRRSVVGRGASFVRTVISIGKVANDAGSTVSTLSTNIQKARS